MTQPYKICPNCQQPAVLTMAVCGRCGRPYRTQFAPPDQTQVVTPGLVPARTVSPAVRIGLYIGGGMAFMALIAFAVLHFAFAPHPLVGAWRTDSANGISYSIVFRADGTYEAEHEGGMGHDEAHWYTEYDRSLGPDAIGGMLWRGYAPDYRGTIWRMSSDKQHLILGTGLGDIKYEMVRSR